MFTGWGAHTDHADVAYLTAAAAVGMTSTEVDRFIKRQEKVLDKVCGRKDEHVLTRKANELMV